MDYYYEVCDIFIKPKSKQNHSKSKIHKELDRSKHIKLTIENLHINDVDKAFYEYIIEHKNKYDCYLIKTEFILVSNDYQCCPYITSKISDKKTMCSWSHFFKKK